MKDLDPLSAVMFVAMGAWFALMGWIFYESMR